MQYQIRHFDGYKIHDFCKNGDEYIIDATDKLTWQTVLQSTDLHDDNALFYQLVKVLYELNSAKLNTIETSECLLEEIVFVHFSYGITNEYRKLFSNGFIVSYENRKITYVPFEKSASMARQGVITFINEDLIKEDGKRNILKRLMLDLELGRISMPLSKLYAYRGLYLSSGKRVKAEELVLNAESVIVIDDISEKTRLTDIITAEEKRETDKEKKEAGVKKFLFMETKEPLQINTTDGLGLISPKYAQILNKELNKGVAKSFQVRMPFTKGMLHQCDFKEYIEANLENKSDFEKLTIKDIFEKDRKIADAEIILTKSMFKCWGWMAKVIKDEDPMEYYFNKFNHYDHSLYVGLTDQNLQGAGKTIKLNYQFLSTLNLLEKDFIKLKEDHLIHADDQKIVARIIADKQIKTVQTEENVGLDGEEAEKSEKYDKEEVWVKSLRKNYKFLSTVKVFGQLNGIKRSILSDMGKGRIYVTGEQRFLCGDLGFLLQRILENCQKNNDAVRFNTAEEKTIFTTNFYMPGNRIKLNANGYYPILRNPHLSRNEQALAKPFIAKKGSFYDKYFGHLTGVVMISADAIGHILGGADFDGDIVKIISNNTITNALLKNENEDNDFKPYEISETLNKKGREVELLTRCMPVIEIPSLTPKTYCVRKKVNFKTIKNSFNSKVGLISNEAIKWAEKAYFSSAVKDEKEESTIIKNKPAHCTIATGLEIDAAKTGVHPDLSDLEYKGKNYFLDLKKSINSDSYKSSYKAKVSDDEKTLVLYVEKKDGSKKTLIKVEDFSGEKTANINRLPYYFAKSMQHFVSFRHCERYKTPPYYFAFEETPWKKDLDEEVKSKVKDIVKAYNTLKENISLTNYISSKYTNSANSSYIYTILKAQYDEVDDVIKETLSDAYKEIEKSLSSYKDATELRKRFIDLKWHFKLKKERKESLQELFKSKEGLFDDKIISLLTNFEHSGYKLLYYIIEDVIAVFADSDIDKYETDKTFTGEGKRLYECYKNIYKNSQGNKEEKVIYKSKIVKKCREDLIKVVETKINNTVTEDAKKKVMDKALKYVYSVEKNTSWAFLWDVFDEEEILRNVYDGKQVKNNAQ